MHKAMNGNGKLRERERERERESERQGERKVIDVDICNISIVALA